MADACRERGVTLIAYSPLALGMLSGKYSADRRPAGARRLMRAFRLVNLRRAARLLHLLGELAEALPIPGVKNAAQAEENAGALRISLAPGERDELDRASAPWRK